MAIAVQHIGAMLMTAIVDLATVNPTVPKIFSIESFFALLLAAFLEAKICHHVSQSLEMRRGRTYEAASSTSIFQDCHL